MQVPYIGCALYPWITLTQLFYFLYVGFSLECTYVSTSTKAYIKCSLEKLGGTINIVLERIVCFKCLN